MHLTGVDRTTDLCDAARLLVRKLNQSKREGQFMFGVRVGAQSGGRLTADEVASGFFTGAFFGGIFLNKRF